jgi:hypothetical protein
MVLQDLFLSYNQALRRASEQVARFSWCRPFLDDLGQTTANLLGIILTEPDHHVRNRGKQNLVLSGGSTGGVFGSSGGESL